jgi:hypothetical protein
VIRRRQGGRRSTREVKRPAGRGGKTGGGRGDTGGERKRQLANKSNLADKDERRGGEEWKKVATKRRSPNRVIRQDTSFRMENEGLNRN